MNKSKIIPHPSINAGHKRAMVRALTSRLIAVRNNRLFIGMDLPLITPALTPDERREYAEAFRREAMALEDMASSLERSANRAMVNPAGEAPFFLWEF